MPSASFASHVLVGMFKIVRRLKVLDLDKLEELLDVMARNLSAALVRYDAEK